LGTAGQLVALGRALLRFGQLLIQPISFPKERCEPTLGLPGTILVYLFNDPFQHRNGRGKVALFNATPQLLQEAEAERRL
jgi:hypothetical protein